MSITAAAFSNHARNIQYFWIARNCNPSIINCFGGDERNRTADPLLARQVLSQLSYTPGFN